MPLLASIDNSSINRITTMAPPNDISVVNTAAAAATSAVVSSSVEDDSKANAATAISVPLPPPTDMIYYTYEGNFQLNCDAEIVSCHFITEDEEKEETSPDSSSTTVHLVLNRTVLHAQGGGQPTDTGVIRLHPAPGNAIDNDTYDDDTKIIVSKILLDRATGVANHMGQLVVTSKSSNDQRDNCNTSTRPSSLLGRNVTVHVDADNRRILSECHTAGHVVDMAMAQCGLVMPATKAYHFLDGPYVEYKGNIAVEERPTVLEQLQAAFQDLVEQDIATEIYNVSRQEAQDMCDRVAENYFQLQDQFGADETVRIVKVAGWPCPCGGTHVKSTGLLKERGWGITGFKCKKGVVRVKYGQDVTGIAKQ